MKTLIFLFLFPLSLFANLRPVPWLTEGAISFLECYLEEHTNARILEFGSGASTVWFVRRTKNLISIEHDTSWHRLVKETIDKGFNYGAKLILLPKPYYHVTNLFPDEYFDLILVDGRNRKGCILHSVRTLKKGGILMLDNSERPYYKKAIDLLKGWEEFSFKQNRPDSCNFFYPNWTTSWWIKP